MVQGREARYLRFGDLDLAAVEWASPVRRREKLGAALRPEVSGVNLRRVTSQACCGVGPVSTFCRPGLNVNDPVTASDGQLQRVESEVSYTSAMLIFF